MKGKNSQNIISSTIWTEFAKAESQLKKQPKEQPKKTAQKTKSEILAGLYAQKAVFDLKLEKLYNDENNICIKWDEMLLRGTKKCIARTKNQRRCIKNELWKRDPTYRKAQSEKGERQLKKHPKTQPKKQPKKQHKKQLKKIKSEILAVLHAKKAEIDLKLEKMYREEFCAILYLRGVCSNVGIKWNEGKLRSMKVQIWYKKRERRHTENDIKRMDPTYRIVKVDHKLKPDNKMKVNMKKIANQLAESNKLKPYPGYYYIYTHPNTKEPCDSDGNIYTLQHFTKVYDNVKKRNSYINADRPWPWDIFPQIFLGDLYKLKLKYIDKNHPNNNIGQ